MLFALRCRDKAGHLEMRKANRAAHLDYLGRHAEAIRLAGPLLDDGLSAPIGSLIVIDLPDLAAARAFADGDPYAQAGVFEAVDIAPFRQVLPPAD